MDTKKAYDELFNLLLYQGVLDVNEEICNIFINYINARLYDLGIEKTKVHFFLREERMEQTANGSFSYFYRYNPFTNEPCKETWNHGTRAFNRDGEIFIDFSITDNYYRKNLSDYNLVSHLIDFIFTLEHELRHTIQKNKYVAKVVDYDNFRYERDLLVLNFTARQDDIQNRYFYTNAHNNMFLEIDANNQASKFVGDQIRKRGIGPVLIYQYGDRKYTIEDVFRKREEEAYLKKEKLDYDFSMLFGMGKYREEVKVDIDPQKIIDILSDEIISANPRTLWDYPTIAYVYNKDGKKKTYWELKKLMQEHPELTSFINEVIENDTFIKI